MKTKPGFLENLAACHERLSDVLTFKFDLNRKGLSLPVSKPSQRKVASTHASLRRHFDLDRQINHRLTFNCSKQRTIRR